MAKKTVIIDDPNTPDVVETVEVDVPETTYPLSGVPQSVDPKDLPEFVKTDVTEAREVLVQGGTIIVNW